MTKYTFNKPFYYYSKAVAIDLIKNALPDWQKSQGFIADGVYAPDIYEKQPLRILVLLSETYGYSGCNMIDIESPEYIAVLNSHVNIVPTINKISKLLWLIFKSIDEEKEFQFDELPRLYVVKLKWPFC